jgi:WD40 repeat protein
MLTVGQEGSPLIEINGGTDIRAVAFAANGEYLVSGSGAWSVGVWRVEDGKQMATMAVMGGVLCLAVSKDGRWIAAGTNCGQVVGWDAKTFEKAFSHREDHGINGVGFSPDSSRLVSASDYGTTSIWDIATRKRVQTLDHRDRVKVVKYSPQGDRIATATENSVRVWDSNNGRLLVDIKAKITQSFHTGLLWFNNHLFVVSDSKIKQIEASTGSTVSEWPVLASSFLSWIALPNHGAFIAYSTERTVTFWDTATHTQLSLIQHPQDIHSIALSPDDRFLAIGGRGGKITINSLSRITVSILSRWIMNSFLAPIIFPCGSTPLYHIYSTFLEPDIRIDDAALQGNQLTTQALRLHEWAKATLACGEWKDALVVAASVSISFCSGTPRRIAIDGL